MVVPRARRDTTPHRSRYRRGSWSNLSTWTISTNLLPLPSTPALTASLSSSIRRSGSRSGPARSASESRPDNRSYRARTSPMRHKTLERLLPRFHRSSRRRSPRPPAPRAPVQSVKGARHPDRSGGEERYATRSAAAMRALLAAVSSSTTISSAAPHCPCKDRVFSLVKIGSFCHYSARAHAQEPF